MSLLPQIPPPDWAKNSVRKQFVGEDLLEAMKLAYPKLALDTNAILIGITDEDMYISESNWGYAFSYRDDDRFAIVSSAHLSESEDEDEKNNKPVKLEVMRKRLRKVVLRDIGFLHYQLQPSYSYDSILFATVDGVSDLDDIGDDYLESDAKARSQQHVEKGDPCFIVRHYTKPERERPSFATTTGCSGYFKEAGLETVQVDLRYGLLLDQRTDFFVPGMIPLELTRVVRTQDKVSRAFGIGGTHNLNVFLVGDKWPFTWMDLILEHGGRSHFQRSNWGWGYLDARYTNRDVSSSRYSGSVVKWNWPGWELKGRGLSYEFPDSGVTARPEQGALGTIKGYNGARLVLTRDAVGNLLNALSSTGDRLTFKYDSSNRVVEAQLKDGKRFTYSYNASGRLSQVTDADKRVTEYGYDWAGRMNRVAQDGKAVCALEYDSGGRVKSETLSEGRTYAFRYALDGNQNVLRVDISDSAGPSQRVGMFPGEYAVNALTQGRR